MTDLRDLRPLERHFFRAPSAHNTQPWVLAYAADRIELGFDPARALPEGDPTQRDLFLSLGTLVEAVLITAACAGIAVEFEPGVDLGQRRVGVFVPAPGLYETPFTPDDLQRRQTSRLAYAPRPLTEDELASARNELEAGTDLHQIATRDVADLYVAGDRHLYDSPKVVEELRSWLRLSRRDPRYEQDGLSYECLGLRRIEASALALLLRPFVYRLLRALRLHRLLTTATTSLVQAEGSVLVLSGAAEMPAQVLTHGRSLLRVWLALARSGLYTHPLSQILDCPATERELAARVGATSGRRPLNVFRVGRSVEPARSHRLSA